VIREKSAQALPGGFMLFLLWPSCWAARSCSSARSKRRRRVRDRRHRLADSRRRDLSRRAVRRQSQRAQVIALFGNYAGSARFWWVNPFSMRRRVSLRVRNFESAKLKVNDHDGNPIEIAAVVVWRVFETAEAMFEVDDYNNFVHVQSEAAVRNLATSYPYDAHVEGQMGLRGHTQEIAGELQKEIQARLESAGVRVLEARISHLAYAPEIASAMLQRQQASAVSPRARRSSKARSAWWKWRWPSSRRSRSSCSTTSARPRWSVTCSSSSAAIVTRSRW
jgi:hypothetical protein